MNQLELKNVCFSYVKDKPVLNNINLNFQNGKLYAITGKSGAGKTTLLSILSMLTKPSDGDILFENKNIKDMNPYEFRSKKIGVVFQSYNLLPQLTAVENVVLSMDIAGIKQINKYEYAKTILEKVGLTDDEIHRQILKLSGGQQQRVAIARALSYNPAIILADEPTGNLDNETENDILSIFKQLAKEEEKCIIIVTHSNKVANAADYLYRL